MEPTTVIYANTDKNHEEMLEFERDIPPPSFSNGYPDSNNRYAHNDEVPPPFFSPRSSEECNYKEVITKDCDRKIRHGFIRKVFGIISLQLIFTGGVIALFINYDPIPEFLLDHLWILYTLLGVFLVLTILLAFVPSLSLKYPQNIIMLVTYTLVMSVMVGFITCFHRSDIVLYAFLATFGIFIALILFATQTKYDFTGWGPYIMVITLGFLIFGLMAILFHSRALSVLYSALGALLCSLYIIYDTQLIVGGKKYEYPVDAYVMAALNIYSDVINLFLYLLAAFSGSSR